MDEKQCSVVVTTELHYLQMAETEVLRADHVLAKARDTPNGKHEEGLKSGVSRLLAKLPSCIEIDCGRRATLKKELDNGTYFACHRHALPNSESVPLADEADALETLIRE